MVIVKVGSAANMCASALGLRRQDPVVACAAVVLSVFAFLFVLQARLIGGNTITAAGADVTPLPDGAFSCRYVAPPQAGLYVLEVTADGRHVGGSPFSVRVSVFGYAAYTVDGCLPLCSGKLVMAVGDRVRLLLWLL